VGWTPQRAPRREGSDLAAPGDRFVGRGEEMAALAATLEAPCLVTLSGPGGIGKTRLAVSAARRWRAEGRGEAWRCPLSEASGLSGLVAAVAGALGVPRARGDAEANAAHMARGQLAAAWGRGGAIEQALAEQARSEALMRRFQDPVRLAEVIGIRAEIHWRAGDAPAARAALAEAEGTAPPGSQRIAEVLAALGAASEA